MPLRNTLPENHSTFFVKMKMLGVSSRVFNLPKIRRRLFSQQLISEATKIQRYIIIRIFIFALLFVHILETLRDN